MSTAQLESDIVTAKAIAYRAATTGDPKLAADAVLVVHALERKLATAKGSK